MARVEKDRSGSLSAYDVGMGNKGEKDARKQGLLASTSEKFVKKLLLAVVSDFLQLPKFCWKTLL